MRILVTGGFGFLGSRISQRLSAVSEEIMILSRNEEIIRRSAMTGNIKPVCIDTDNINSLGKLAAKVDVVIHAAGPNRVVCELNPSYQRARNIIFAKNLALLFLREGKIKRFINLSSVSVYGETLDGMITETSPVDPKSAYGQVKLAVERTFIEQFEKFGCSEILTNLRISNGFGRPSNFCTTLVEFQPFINQIVDQVKRKQKMVIQNNPAIKKDFVPCLKICDVIEELINPDLIAPRILNMSSGTTRSLESVCSLISDAMRGLILSPEYLQKAEETPDFSIPCNFPCSVTLTSEDYFKEELSAMLGT